MLLPLPLFLMRVSPVEDAVDALAFSSEVTAVSKLNMVENKGSKFDLGFSRSGGVVTVRRGEG